MPVDKFITDKIYPKIREKDIRQFEAVPEYVRPVVTLSDKDNKFMMRYFVRYADNKDLVLEVDKNQHSKFKTNLRFLTTEVVWRIVGKKETIKQPNNIELFGIIDLNKIAVTKADLTFGGLRNYITNYSEFWLGET